MNNANAAELAQANSEFWDELCGTSLAKGLGITDHSPESIRRFDDAYLGMYPYLLDRVPVGTMRGRRVMEVGLGYGTLGQKIAEAGADYIGVDIAAGPVRMMRHRLALQGISGDAMKASVLDCPLESESVDCVVSIGCYHHTGDTQRAIDETWRVLRPGGMAYLMVYNALSYRQWLKWPRETRLTLLRDYGLGRGAEQSSEDRRRAYDANAAGVAAPETEFFSIHRLRSMLSRFRRVQLWKENNDPWIRGSRVVMSRETLLPYLGRMLGLDIYLAAQK